MKKELFVKTFGSLLDKTNEILNGLHDANSLFTTTYKYHINQSDNSIGASRIQALQKEWAIRTIHFGLREESEYGTLESLLSGWDKISRLCGKGIGTTYTVMRFSIDELIQNLLIAALPDPLIDSTMTLDAIYDAVVRFANVDTIPVIFRMYLENVEIGNSNIIMNDAITGIYRINTADKCRMLNTDPIYASSYGFQAFERVPSRYVHFANINHYIEVRVEENRIIYDGDFKINPEGHQQYAGHIARIHNALTALKLIGDPIVHHSKIYSSTKFYPFGGFGVTLGEDSNQWPLIAISIDKDMSTELMLAYDLITGKNTSHLALRIALERLNMHSWRQRYEDMILDFTVGFEALVGEIWKGTQTDSLKFKAALTVAKYIGSDDIDEEKAFDLVNRCISIRNKLVHGGEPEKISEDTYRAISEIFRRFLFKYMKDCASGRMIDGKGILFKSS